MCAESRGVLKEAVINGLTVRMFLDPDPADPREDSGRIGRMVCYHPHHVLGDKHDMKPQDYTSWDHWERVLKAREPVAVILPIYLYDHSGIALSTSHQYPFNDPWDSCQVGFIYATEQDVLDTYSVDTPDSRADMEDELADAVSNYSKYLNGTVFGYSVVRIEHCPSCKRDMEETVDMCGGYYDDEACWDSAVESANRGGIGDPPSVPE